MFVSSVVPDRVWEAADVQPRRCAPETLNINGRVAG
jgi:hypothetical protein